MLLKTILTVSLAASLAYGNPVSTFHTFFSYSSQSSLYISPLVLLPPLVIYITTVDVNPLHERSTSSSVLVAVAVARFVHVLVVGVCFSVSFLLISSAPDMTHRDTAQTTANTKRVNKSQKVCEYPLFAVDVMFNVTLTVHCMGHVCLSPQKRQKKRRGDKTN
jgi:hypothetical protein